MTFASVFVLLWDVVFSGFFWLSLEVSWGGGGDLVRFGDRWMAENGGFGVGFWSGKRGR